MGKGKMSLLDVRAMVKELQAKLIGLRVGNIYNLNAKTFLLKMSGTDVKQMLLVESGVRLHTTKYAREHDKLPSNFCAKLRKHLRLKRLERITQIGIDRIVDMQFGHGEQAHHLILEFYAQGNIILTDANYRIIMLLRVHTYATAGGAGAMTTIGAGAVLADGDAPAPKEAEGAASSEAEDRVAVHEQYPMGQAQQVSERVTEEMVRACIEKQQRKEADELTAWQAKMAAEDAAAAAVVPEEDSVAGSGNQQGKKQHAKEQERLQAARKAREAEAEKRKLSKPKMKAGMPLKAILSQDLHFGPDVIEHCLMQTGIDPNQSLAQFIDSGRTDDQTDATMSSAQLTLLCSSLQEAPLLLDRIAREPMPGYIYWRVETQGDAAKVAHAQAQSQAAPKRKAQGKRNDKGELVVDEIDAPATAPTADATATATDAPTQTESTVDATAETASSTSATPAAPAAIPSAATADSSSGFTVYTEYLPILLSPQLQRPEYRSMPAPLSYASFDDAMDEFYSKAEEQKEQVRLVKERIAALQKLEREKARQRQQLQALEAQQATSVLKASLIEQNLDAVNACLLSVNAEIAKGTDWRDLTRMIKAEKEHGQNSVARMIHSLRLLENQITVTLSEGLRHLLPAEALRGAPRVQVVQVDLDLALSAFANAQLYYESKKRHAEKQSRAESASIAAIRAAERKTNTALSAVDIRARIQKARKVYWFEKFHWFISSENFLVIGGKDAQQNEMIVKKYLGPNDVYVHAEVHGASSVVVKNPTGAPVPPLTLSQAGTMTICRSSAWKGKIAVEAYWVRADQVSKTPPTGLFLPTGSFMIRGKKNFLPRAPLIMGVALLFRVDDECRAAHAGERRIRTAAEDATAPEDKYDQVADLPETSGGGKSHAGSSSSKKKKGGATGSGSHKKKSTEVDADDFDVTSNLRPVTAAAAAAAIGRLTSEDEATDAEEEERRARVARAAAAPPAGKKKMSAAERKRLKKGGGKPSQEAAPAEEEEVEEPETAQEEAVPVAESKPAHDSSDDDDDWGTKKNKKGKKKGAKKSAAASGAAAAPAAAPAKPLPRGKRNKAKRIASKYADQDEEDLILAAGLLGLQGVDKKKQEVAEREKAFKPTKAAEEETVAAEEEEDKEEEEEDDEAASDPAASPLFEDDSTKICFNCKERGHVFKSCPRRGAADGTTFSQAKKMAESEEAAALDHLKEEEGMPEGDETDNAASAAAEALELQALTGRPTATDLSHFILPVCAPYDALSEYKYRLKLLPGMGKKGKAAKQALQLFRQSDKATTAETDLLKLVPEQDIINVLLSNLKLAAPGADGGKGKKKKNKPTNKTADE